MPGFTSSPLTAHRLSTLMHTSHKPSSWHRIRNSAAFLHCPNLGGNVPNWMASLLLAALVAFSSRYFCSLEMALFMIAYRGLTRCLKWMAVLYQPFSNHYRVCIGAHEGKATDHRYRKREKVAFKTFFRTQSIATYIVVAPSCRDRFVNRLASVFLRMSSIIWPICEDFAEKSLTKLSSGLTRLPA